MKLKPQIHQWINQLGYLWFLRTGPRMIYGFRRSDGVYLPLFRVASTTFIDHRKSFFPEDNVYIGHHNYLEASGSIRIGRGCQITNYVSVLTHSTHNSIRYYDVAPGGERTQGYVRASVEIGPYTFIGPHTVVMPGTRIGKGCIVAAFSYLDGDYPAFSILKGTPARIVGDTRKKDAKVLSKDPSIQSFYESWAGISYKSFNEGGD